jgi:hypothetical protein
MLLLHNHGILFRYKNDLAIHNYLIKDVGLTNLFVRFSNKSILAEGGKYLHYNSLRGGHICIKDMR